jgi:hypothetical protein
MNTTISKLAFRGNFSWLRYLPLFLAVLFANGPAKATTVIPPDFNKLVSQADYIVRGVVTSVTSEMVTGGGERRHIMTKVTVEVRQVISGTPPQPLVLQMLGGTVGEETMTVEGAPKFKVGDEDILFVHGNGQQFTPLVAFMHGRYPIKTDKTTGREYVARSNGSPLFNEQEVDQPMEASAPSKSAAGVAAQPLSPADFVARIQNAITQNSRAKLEN